MYMYMQVLVLITITCIIIIKLLAKKGLNDFLLRVALIIIRRDVMNNKDNTSIHLISDWYY